ncbi:hypothetical protein BDR05DRAFT_492729 [Suillus weaverae]|nr:hypothetical protein BDR05DRAFT_492729 [Suillus weaverae]
MIAKLRLAPLLFISAADQRLSKTIMPHITSCNSGIATCNVDYIFALALNPLCMLTFLKCLFKDTPKKMKVVPALSESFARTLALGAVEASCILQISDGSSRVNRCPALRSRSVLFWKPSTIKHVRGSHRSKPSSRGPASIQLRPLVALKRCICDCVPACREQRKKW